MYRRTQLLLDQVSALEKAGQWQEAIDLCESVFREGVAGKKRGDVLEAILRLGLLYGTRGDSSTSRDYFELALEVSTRSCDTDRAARALNSIGVQLQRAGDLNGAEHRYTSALEVAERGASARTRGDIEVNLGIVANIRGDLEVALHRYKSALNEYEQINHTHRIARVLNNLGMLYTDLKEYDRAAETLARALETCREVADVQVEGIVLTNQTELMLITGDYDGARASCDEAFEIASRLDDRQLKAEVLKSYGVIFRLDGKPHLSETHLKQAIDLASRLGFPLIEADANRELALVLRSLDRNRDALAALNRAHVLFLRLQAKQEQADIDKRFKQLEEDFLSLVAKWGASIEAKDRYTSGHCERVADYACAIAAAAGLPELELSWFRMGAFLHDVGKTEVPEEILNKPGRLTDEERLIIERHTIAGDEMLASIEFPWDIRPMVRSHHERWDGKGYPDRLSGTAIPFTARILHIADVFDALTTTRSYRQPLSARAAYEVMESDHGSFDPDLFRLFGGLLSNLSGPFGQLAADA